MTFTPHLAERRFGYGLSPVVQGPEDVPTMLRGVAGPDVMREAWPVPDFQSLRDALVARRKLRGFARKNAGTDVGRNADQEQKALYRAGHENWTRAFLQVQRRRILTPHALRERLVAFWADHFTAVGKGGLLRFGATAYVDEAIRPHVNGSFAEMLKACVTHPLMLEYLDQSRSAGPGSILVRRRPQVRGLNENLARELLELHTLGVDGPYTQTDVRELAELLTGLSRGNGYGFVFRRNMAEPGAETVLGKTYGKGASLQHIEAALEDLARHPSTAAHIARKLVVHFVSDTPSDALVARVADAYATSNGALMAVYEALLTHPDAWTGPAQNIRPPQEFMSTALRAFGAPGRTLAEMKPRQIGRLFLSPLRLMGQRWEAAAGPDGWPEDDAAWVTPQGIAARLEWAVHAPTRFLDALPEPQKFVRDALGDDASERVLFVAGAAETRAEALGLVLVSPAFQRR